MTLDECKFQARWSYDSFVKYLAVTDTVDPMLMLS